ncbi:hypothetical protein MTsPCn9_27160 [Croceitalea sp. MTPC9]|uniref:hypothetical protein n=1 Tax=unclassified Croceitalea TaxID=2632280 RepID=UPI002B3B4491|nr:hypothetical protein MTsPCn6_23020 [Croceitalea sp. MTPC6]GMN17778.1 hypothetical protein MTsPCn9_27160 [Croceitalea sp. MTPC9]
MKISCDKAAEICNKSQYKEASWWQILKLRFHILYCKSCAKFSAKNTKFTSLCDSANLKTLESSDKESMKKALKEQL